MVFKDISEAGKVKNTGEDGVLINDTGEAWEVV